MLGASLILALALMLICSTAAVASPGSLRVLVVTNEPTNIVELPPAIAAQPGVAVVDTFNSGEGTPDPAVLASYDLVVGTGDSTYKDPVAWGNELAGYLDAGGAEIQFAYDNWESAGAHPTGRFETGEYAPFVPGPNENFESTLGTLLLPASPLLAGVPSFTVKDNVTPTLATGATLLAEWANHKPAIATKGRVVSVSASPDEGEFKPISAAARLAVNAGNVLGRQTLTITKAAGGAGTVTSTPAGINCGPTCAFNFTAGTVVTLAAAASRGSTFAGWSGGGCAGTSTCTVTMSSAQAVTATFAIAPPPPPPPVAPANTKIATAHINKRKHSGSFTFSASGTLTGFQCALVKLPPKKAKHHAKPKVLFSTCRSPKAYKHLKHGRYTFEVRAFNSVGHDVKPAVKSFQI